MEKTTAKKFEEYFQLWLEEIQKPEIMISSDTIDYIDNDPYKKIIKLGDDVLPFLMDKIGQGYFFLNHAVSEITGKKITDITPVGSSILSQQEISRLWLTWWKKQKHSQDDPIKNWDVLFTSIFKNKFDIPNNENLTSVLKGYVSEFDKDKAIKFGHFLPNWDTCLDFSTSDDSKIKIHAILNSEHIIIFYRIPKDNLEFKKISGKSIMLSTDNTQHERIQNNP